MIRKLINFVIDSKVVKSITVDDDSQINPPSEEECAGYIVNSWYFENLGENVEWEFDGYFGYRVKDDITLYADFECRTYTISFKDEMFNNLVADFEAKFNRSIQLPVLVQEGYDFIGWFYKDNKIINKSLYDFTFDIDVEARWSSKQYSVSLDPSGGQCDSSSIMVRFDDTYELPIPTRKNYTFIGWYDLNDNFVSSKSVWKSTSITTLCAQWTNIQNTYTLDCGGGSCDISTIVIGWEDPYELPIPTMEGADFLCWSFENQTIQTTGTSWNYSNVGGVIYANWITKDLKQKFGFEKKYYEKENYVSFGTDISQIVTSEDIINKLDQGAIYPVIQINDYLFYEDELYKKVNESWYSCSAVKWDIINNQDDKLITISQKILGKANYYEYGGNDFSSTVNTICSNLFQYSINKYNCTPYLYLPSIDYYINYIGSSNQSYQGTEYWLEDTTIEYDITPDSGESSCYHEYHYRYYVDSNGSLSKKRYYYSGWSVSRYNGHRSSGSYYSGAVSGIRLCAEFSKD